MLQQPLGEVGEHGVLELDRDSSSAVRQVGVDPSVRVLTELPGIGRLVEVVTDEEPGALHHARDDAGARAARRTDDRRPGGEEPGGEQGREGGLNRQRTSGRRSGGGAARRRRVRCARGTRGWSRHVHRAGVVHLLLVPVARSIPLDGLVTTSSSLAVLVLGLFVAGALLEAVLPGALFPDDAGGGDCVLASRDFAIGVAPSMRSFVQ